MNIYRKYVFPDKDFPLGVVPMEPHGPTSMHTHDFEELAIVHEGSGKHVYEEQEYDISAGDVYTIKPGMKHSYAQTNGLCLTNILYISSRLGLKTEDISSVDGYHVLFDLEPRYRSQTRFQTRLKLNPIQLDNLMSMVERLKLELWGDKPGRKFMALTELRNIVGYLSRTYSESPEKNTRLMLIVSRAMQYMGSHLNDSLKITNIASACHVSESTLLRAFKECIVSTPVRYMAQMRIQHACRLLRNDPGANITEIGFRSGYNDSNYFIRQFHQIMGTTPGKYRKTL